MEIPIVRVRKKAARNPDVPLKGLHTDLLTGTLPGLRQRDSI